MNVINYSIIQKLTKSECNHIIVRQITVPCHSYCMRKESNSPHYCTMLQKQQISSLLTMLTLIKATNTLEDSVGL